MTMKQFSSQTCRSFFLCAPTLVRAKAHSVFTAVYYFSLVETSSPGRWAKFLEILSQDNTVARIETSCFHATVPFKRNGGISIAFWHFFEKKNLPDPNFRIIPKFEFQKSKTYSMASANLSLHQIATGNNLHVQFLTLTL